MEKEGKRVVQISIDVVLDKGTSGDEFAKFVDETLENAGYNVRGYSCVGDVSEFYE